MAISVLGPLDVGGLRPRDRTVLAALAARRGAVVSADELAEACWGSQPPATWWQQIKSSVASIRSELGSDAVRTDAHGYGLGLDPESLDSVRFERAVESARVSVVRGRPERAAQDFRRALDLWRGAPFGDVGATGPARDEAMRLIEIRSTVEEELLEARLAAGEAASVVAEAERLTREAPLREARWAILAVAQYRADRQADALAVLRTARARLIEDLGVEPGPRLSALEIAILRHDPVLGRPAPASDPGADCPYPGLRAFDGSAADRFFGRDPDIAVVLDRATPGSVVAIVGPSGCGKSSLLLGGVLPALATGPGTQQLLRLDAQADAEVAAVLKRPARPDVLAIDQFEELFQRDLIIQERLCSALGTLLSAGLTVIVTLRSDFLDRATALPQLGARIGGGVYALGPLGRDGLREAIEQPAITAGLRVEPGLVGLMLRDADGRPAALPHLAHALVETWQRREGGALTVEGYETSGGIAGAIANSAEERYQLLSVEEQQSCRSLLMRLLERDQEGGIVRRRLPLAALLGDARRSRVIEELVASRLLAVDGESLGVAHEAIARAWPRLDAWLTEDAESAAALHRVEEGAAAWIAAGRSADDLPRGARLAALAEWRERTAPDLTAAETEFLHAARDMRRSEIEDIAARAERERRQNRRLRVALVGAAVLLVVSLVAGALAVIREQDANAAQRDARTEALAAVAKSLVGTDRDAGALLAAELYRRDPGDVRARSALLALLSAPGTPDRKIWFGSDERIFAAPVPNTDQVVVAEDAITTAKDGHGLRLGVWDLSTGRLVRRLAARLPDAVTYHAGGLHVRPDGVIVAAYPTWDDPSSCCGTILASVDLRTGELIHAPVRLPYEVADSGVFTDGGRTLALKTWDAAVPVWVDVATLRADTGEAHLGAVRSDGGGIALLPNGEVAVAGQDRITRFDPRRRAYTRSVALPADLASDDIAPVGDGTVLTNGPAGTARVRIDDGLVLWRTDQPALGCGRVVVLATRGTFVCSSSTSWEARIADGVRTGRTFPAQAEWISQVGEVGGGLLLVNQRTTPFVERFPVDDSGPISSLVAAGRIAVGGFADARTIVVGDRDSEPDTGGQLLWDVRTDRQIGPRSDFVDALGGGIVMRYTSLSDRQVVTRVGGGRAWPLHGGAFLGGSVHPRAGSTTKRAFAISDDFIQPFDPATGAAIGPALNFPDKELKNYWVMVHDTPAGDRALVSWWDVDEASMTTAMFDLRTGRKIREGLKGDVASVLLPSGGVISTTSTELRRSTPELKPIGSLPKPVAGANLFQLSADGRTLLLQGQSQPATLYDIPSGTKLGNDIPTNSPNWSSAYLDPSGKAMITNASNGVLLWRLDPAVMAKAACAMAGRRLSASEWRGSFGDEPQVDTCRLLRASPAP